MGDHHSVTSKIHMEECMDKILGIMISVLLVASAGGSWDVRGEPIRSFDLLGAGASCPAPLMTAWADEYRDLTSGKVIVNYQSIGTGGGIRQFLEKMIMYGATESVLTDSLLALITSDTGGLADKLP